jgi:hypothetical protein
MQKALALMLLAMAPMATPSPTEVVQSGIEQVVQVDAVRFGLAFVVAEEQHLVAPVPVQVDDLPPVILDRSWRYLRIVLFDPK